MTPKSVQRRLSQLAAPAAGETRDTGTTDEILIVEADPDLRALLEHTFENEGFETESRDRGAGALTHIEDGGRPSCVLLDLRMPGVSGLDVLAERADEAFAAIPVIVLTGMDGDTVERAFDRGADDYVLKPFSPGELVAKVQQMLSHSSG